ncbi:MAG: hypothetical protein M4579_000602 [Chaenotheca gracillima]|nr:MAG: hypothetical protein M4579_000602 [Chaenotheca gracillima]
MVREDLIASAVNFLQDPSVGTSPIAKRVAFLQSKNLTQEEIDVALARAGDEAPQSSTTSPPVPPRYGYQNQQMMQRGSPRGYEADYWQQPPPPELPRRDWRDWFIMATVMGGVSYGMYFVAKVGDASLDKVVAHVDVLELKRYIYPLIAPPTPPQLEQDKESIDESFNKAFALLDQLATDTETLKSSEQARTERLDKALHEVESVISELKTASRRREDEGRRMGDEIKGLKDLIPKGLEAQKENTDARLRELSTELKSLKTLVGNRMGAAPLPRATSDSGSPSGTQSPVTANGNAPKTPTVRAADGKDGVAASQQPAQSNNNAPLDASSVPSDRKATSTPFGSSVGTGNRAAIPAWQMAAAKNKSGSAIEPSAEPAETSGSA